MTNGAKMAALLDGCPSSAEAARLLQSAIERLYADDADPPAELSAALEALDVAIEKLDALDQASA